jgi:hypothetical protein
VTHTLVVDARRAAREEPRLGMRCDAREIPDPLGGPPPVGWWVVGLCTFGGTAETGEEGSPGEPFSGVVKGTAALAVAAGRVIGIASGSSPSSPALWWSWDLSAAKATAAGSTGLMKKRPNAIQLDLNGGVDGDGDTFVFKAVSRLDRQTSRAIRSEEGSLLAALGG